MTKGKYSRPRRRRRRLNPRFVILVLILLTIIALLGTWLLRSCSAKPESETASDSQVSTAPSTQATTPTTLPTTAPTTAPTEATTQPTTEPTTAPTESPTEPPTEAPTEEPTTAPTEPPVPESSSVGEQIAQTAIAQIGKPYSYGGVGPDSFDTSGFAVYCYAQSGITIPRTTPYQYQQGTAVPKDALEPGDILIFWSENPGEAEYEGIYIGNGKFVAARHGDKPVTEMALNVEYFTTRYIGACRYY